MLTGGGPEVHDTIDAGLEVLLAEPAPGTGPKPGNEKPKGSKSGS